MVFSCVAFADGGLHETGKGREDVDGWVDAFVVKLTVDEDLALGDVASQVGDGMCNIYTFVSPFEYQWICCYYRRLAW